MTEKYYDNTMLESFRKCHRLYYFHHVRDWAPETKSHNLIFGECWHSAMDVVWMTASSAIPDELLVVEAMMEFSKTWDEYYPDWGKQIESPFGTTLEEEMYPKTPARAQEMLTWYLKKRRPQIAKYEIIGVELPFIAPIGDEDTFYVGRNDKVIRKEDKRVYTIDHKTTKSGKDAWLATFQPNNQIDGYNYAGVLSYGEDFRGVEIDGALCQKGSQKNYFDPSLPIGIGFPQHLVLAATGLTQAWLWETSYTIKLLESHLEMLRECKPDDEVLMAFDKRTTACGYYSGCIYRSICAFVSNPAQLLEPPQGFKIEKWQPFDILDVAKRVHSESGVEL